MLADPFFSYNEKIIPAKKGNTLYVENTIIHSRYDPELEAEKYIDFLELRPYKYFILIEPGLGYLSAALKKRFPLSEIITLHCSSFYDNPGSCWNPKSKETLEDFLEISLGSTDAAEIKLVDWKPSINAYGKACLDLASRAVETIRRISAGQKTIKKFGRRWLKNALRNLSLLHYPLMLFPGSQHVLVCAAGPSLENSLGNIAKWIQNISPPFIIAVSSAVPALLNHKIRPDLIITTDGGFWARLHLLYSFSRFKENVLEQKEKPVIACALTSALPSQINTWPSLFIGDGSLWQAILLSAAFMSKDAAWKSKQKKYNSFPALVFPQRGTVSATALDLAFYISSGNIYICGFDFAHNDLRTHSRPHAFENFMEPGAYRNQPLYSQAFKRENYIRGSGSLNIYEAWFTSHLSLYNERLFTFGESMHGIPSREPLASTEEKKNRFNFLKMESVNSIHLQTDSKLSGFNNKKYLIGVLLDALNNPLLSEQLYMELGEMLINDTSIKHEKYADLVKKALLEL